MFKKSVCMVLVLTALSSMTLPVFSVGSTTNKPMETYEANISSYVNSGIRNKAFYCDRNTAKVLDEQGGGKIIADSIEDSMRCTDIEYKNGSTCSMTISNNGVNVAIRSGDVIVEYLNGKKIKEYNDADSIVNFELKADVKDYILNHTFEESCARYDGSYVSSSGEFVLPIECYQFSDNSGIVMDNNAWNVITSTKASTEVIPVKLESSYPQQTQLIVHSANKYVPALSKNVNFRVTTSRNKYYRESGSFKKVVAGVSLALAAQQVLVVSSVLKGILSAYGLFSAATGTVSAFSFPDKLEYKAWMSKVGWVYDSTTFGNYVRYIGTTVTGWGTITLGWDVNNSYYRSNFKWMITSQPAYINRTNEAVVNMTFDAYNSDVAQDGRCDTEYYCVWNYGGQTI